MNFSIKRILLAAALTGLAGAASAADVRIYGTVNAGMKYSDMDVAGSSLVMSKGGEEDVTSRVGIVATEKLTDTVYVKAHLATALNIDSGSIREFPLQGSNTLFNLESSLSIGNDNVEVQFGRIGALTSTYGTWNGYTRLRINPTRSALKELGGGMHVNHFVLDNAVLVTTKNREGLFGTLLYSNGDRNKKSFNDSTVVDQESAYDWEERRHMAQGLVGFKRGPFMTGLIYSYDTPVEHPGQPKKANEQHLHYTMSWDFGSFLLSGTAYWAKNARSAFSTSLNEHFKAAGASGQDLGIINRSCKGLEIKSLYLGAGIPLGKDFAGISMGYGKAEWDGDALKNTSVETEGDMYRFGGVYRYGFSKSTYAYGAAVYLHGDKLLKAVTGTVLAAGLVHKF